MNNFRKSKNPSNGKNYNIPIKLDDQKNISRFHEDNKNKKIVVVQGLGFVGSVMSLLCANSENEDYAVLAMKLLRFPCI